MEKNALTFLFDSYEETLEEIRQNRGVIKTNQSRNKELQEQLRLVKENMLEIIKIEVKKHGSLYKACKAEFGKIDKRFYKICSMFGNKL